MADRDFSDDRRLPSFRHLRVFEAVARCGNLSRAAAETNMSQPAVTQAVSKIEKWVDARLFERNRTGTFLTEEGRIFRSCIQRLFEQIETALEQSLLRDTPKEVVRSAIARLKTSQIDVLAAVARSSSFEDAALALGLSRTAVQRTARELELTLGRELYQRTPHGLVANAAAKSLATALQRACQTLREGLQDVSAARRKSDFRIFVGVQPLAPVALIASAVNRLLAEHPGAQVKIVEGLYRHLLQELRSGRIDMIFGPLKRPHLMDDIAEEALYQTPYCVAARQGHPLSKRLSVTLRDLLDVDWIVPGAGTKRRKAFDKLFESEGSRPTSCIDAASISAQIAILASSDRVTLLTPIELALEPQMAGLVALPMQPRIKRPADGLTLRANWRPTPVQLCFIEHLRSCIRDLNLPTPVEGLDRVELSPLQHAG